LKTYDGIEMESADSLSQTKLEKESSGTTLHRVGKHTQNWLENSWMVTKTPR